MAGRGQVVDEDGELTADTELQARVRLLAPALAGYRLADGKQVQRKLGPAHTGRGRCPASHHTERTAREALDAILTNARRGTVAGASIGSGATFADTAAEFLRFVRDVRKIDPTTVKDYAGVIDGYLLDRFDDRAVAAITADDVDAYKEILLSEGRLSNRTIVRHLVVLNGILKRAKRKGWITENRRPTEMVERPPVTYTGEFDTFARDDVDCSRRTPATRRTRRSTGLPRTPARQRPDDRRRR